MPPVSSGFLLCAPSPLVGPLRQQSGLCQKVLEAPEMLASKHLTAVTALLVIPSLPITLPSALGHCFPVFVGSGQEFLSHVLPLTSGTGGGGLLPALWALSSEGYHRPLELELWQAPLPVWPRWSIAFPLCELPWEFTLLPGPSAMDLVGWKRKGDFFKHVVVPTPSTGISD